MLRNPYRRLQDLIDAPPLQVGDVTAIVDGIATVVLPGGGTLQARGAATIAARVFVRGGVIEGEAPALPVELIVV